jgi:hypothetical protein
MTGDDPECVPPLEPAPLPDPPVVPPPLLVPLPVLLLPPLLPPVDPPRVPPVPPLVLPLPLVAPPLLPPELPPELLPDRPPLLLLVPAPPPEPAFGSPVSGPEVFCEAAHAATNPQTPTQSDTVPNLCIHHLRLALASEPRASEARAWDPLKTGAMNWCTTAPP